MNIHYEESQCIGSLDWPNAMTPNRPHQPPQPEIDPDYVMLGFSLVEKTGINDQSGSLLLKTTDAKKMNLMVGDIMTIKLTEP